MNVNRNMQPTGGGLYPQPKSEPGNGGYHYGDEGGMSR